MWEYKYARHDKIDKYPNDLLTLKLLLSRLMKCVRDTAKFVDNL